VVEKLNNGRIQTVTTFRERLHEDETGKYREIGMELGRWIHDNYPIKVPSNY